MSNLEIAETPVIIGEFVFTPRRNPGESRWQIFADKDGGMYGAGPVAYIELVDGRDGRRAKVEDSAGRQIGETAATLRTALSCVRDHLVAAA